MNKIISKAFYSGFLLCDFCNKKTHSGYYVNFYGRNKVYFVCSKKCLKKLEKQKSK